MFEDTEERPKTIRAFRHAKIRQFKIGRFTFKDHVLKLSNEHDVHDFLELAAGLPQREKIHLTELANVENERPLDLARATRGVTTTTDVRDARDRTGAILGNDGVLRANPHAHVGGSPGAHVGAGDVGDQNGNVNLEQANALVDQGADSTTGSDDGTTPAPTQDPTNDPADAEAEMKGEIQQPSTTTPPASPAPFKFGK